MKVQKWLTINSRGSARLTQTKPHLDWNEISIALEVNLPDALFDKPRLEARIDIPEEAATPNLIDAHVVENVQEAIKQATGLEFSINVIRTESNLEDEK